MPKRIGLTWAKRRDLQGFIFVLPALAFFLIFLLYPILNAVWVSLTNWNLISVTRFIGFDNYIKLFQSSSFRHSLRVTLVYSGLTTFGVMVLSLVMALLVTRKGRGTHFFQSLYFMPTVVSVTVAGVIWQFMLNRLGLVNGLMRSFFGMTIPWLASSDYAMASVIIMSLWKLVGYYMVIFMAGLQSIPSVCYEAARVDGASGVKAFRYITLPLLKPTTLFVVIIAVVETLQSFTQFYVMTSGGPGDATRVLAMKIYEDAMLNLQMGLATAEALILFLILLIFTVIQLRIFDVETN